jgi:hypothetical protein
MQVKGVFQTYATISLNDLSRVDFSQIGETSEDTIRKNVLDPPTQFVVKWDVEPAFIADGTVIPDGLYTHEECLELMATSTWSLPDPIEE